MKRIEQEEIQVNAHKVKVKRYNKKKFHKLSNKNSNRKRKNVKTSR
jgi:hypothetical protein